MERRGVVILPVTERCFFLLTDDVPLCYTEILYERCLDLSAVYDNIYFA